MKYLKIFEDFERSAYTKISPKTLSRCIEYTQQKYSFLNVDLFEDVDVIPGGDFLYNDSVYDSIESLIEGIHKYALSVWNYKSFKYKINNGFLDIDNIDINLYAKKITKIPYKFGKVDGHFWCHNNQLTTLSGVPKNILGNFRCDKNKLTTLEGGPHTVGGDFLCSDNQLITLEGAPVKIGRDFFCSSNKLTTLKGGPKNVVRCFDCSYNQLTTLEGSPHTVGQDFSCHNNQLTTLYGAPHSVDGSFFCMDNQLKNLKYLPEKIGGSIICWGNPNLNNLSDAPEEWKNKIDK